MSRTLSSSKNMLSALLGQAVTFGMAFIARLVFVKTLGEDYLGISGWFSTILSILSITELGVGTAIVVSLYAPLASGDEKRIDATMRLLRRAYTFVGLAVLAIGLALLPMLPLLIKETTELVDLRVVYLLFLFQSVFSYLYPAYKGSIFTADQKQYRNNLIGCAVSFAQTCLQIAMLLLFEGQTSYLLYVAMMLLGTVCKNWLIASRADRAYPGLLGAGKGEELTKEEKKGIFKNLFGLSLYRVSGTVLNATDSMVLGKYIGFAIIGLYSNYLLVITAVTTVLSMIFSSFTASLGNLSVIDDVKRKDFIFRCLNQMDGWLYGFSAVCLFVLLEPFVRLVFGAEWVFSDPYVKLIIAANFLTSGLLENTIVHKDAYGLFWQGRYRPIFSAGFNILLSILLVGPMGISGVLLATIISRLLTTWWFDPWMVHHYALKTSVKPYFLRTFVVIGVCVAAGGALFLLDSATGLTGTWLGFIAMMLLCMLVPNAIFYLLYRKTEEFQYLKSSALGLIKGIRGKAADQASGSSK